MSRFKVLFKSTAVRLSALYILLFAICAATLVFYVTAMSERLLTNQIREAVQQEVDQVQRAYDAGRDDEQSNGPGDDAERGRRGKTCQHAGECSLELQRGRLGG